MITLIGGSVLIFLSFFRVSNGNRKASLDYPDHAKSNTWYRQKCQTPSTPKSEPNRGSQKRYFTVSISLINLNQLSSYLNKSQWKFYFFTECYQRFSKFFTRSLKKPSVKIPIVFHCFRITFTRQTKYKSSYKVHFLFHYYSVIFYKSYALTPSSPKKTQNHQF